MHWAHMIQRMDLCIFALYKPDFPDSLNLLGILDGN